MKIGILHISDLHISNESYLDKVDLIVQACSFDIKNESNVYIVISGDITQYGKKEEFEKAKIFLKTLKDKIKPKNSLLTVDLVLVPGNHDCCFDNVKTTREIIINSCRTDFITEEDYFSDAMAVQENFWEFYEEINSSLPKDKLAFKSTFQPHINNKIIFHCYNSSWMSEIHETPGSLIIPQNKFLDSEYSERSEFVISLFHHPLEWLSPNTKNNNKSRFEEHITKTSNLILFGHEHDKGKSKNIIQKGNSAVFCGAKAFQKDKIDETGFSFYEIDLIDKSTNVKVYKWNKENYALDFEDKYLITEKIKREFSLSSEFEKKITTLNIPLKHSRKEKLELSDVFVYPDLEPIDNDQTVVQYPNSEELIDLVRDHESVNVLVEGEDQSGKTTLFFVLLKKLYEIGYNPIYLRGKYTNVTDVKKIIKKAIKEQNHNINLFFQQPRRVLFLDNFHKSSLNSKHRKVLLNNLSSHFDYVFISADNSIGSNITTEEATNLKKFDKYKLLPLGHEKRGELIEQWLRIGEDVMTINEELLLKSIKARFDEINSLIGNRLMPSYPIFVLTLLQGLDDNIISQDFSQTSYAHVYYALITAGLVREGANDNNKLTSYLNILKELAFYLFDKQTETFTESDFDEFYTNYGKLYYKDFSSIQVLSTLSKANIIKYDDENYCFSYKYIFFYLVAQKISSKIDTHEELIEGLCENIHLEKNANILIFLSHHSKAQILIDNIVFTSEIPFENSKPVTLDKNDEFVCFISDFAKEIQDNIIEDRDPKKEIKTDLQNRDKLDRNNNHNTSDDELMPPELKEINQAFRSIKIIGQIVKNQQGDFEKEKLVELVEAAYSASFRYVGFFSEMLIKDKELLIEAITEDIKEITKDDKAIIEKSVKQFLQYISWRVCMDSFTGLMFSVGTKGRNELYETVASKMGSTAAKMVTFAIKSYYEKISIEELKQLFKETENNYLAQSILKVYIRKHLYTNIIERRKRDQIIQIAGFNPQSMVKRLKSSQH
jgi:predicted MPP superfamily phosphohydrolase